MALLRTELQGLGRTICQKLADGTSSTITCGIYDGIVETAEDLTDDRCTEFDPGSIMLCLANCSFYVKGGDGTWSVLAI